MNWYRFRPLILLLIPFLACSPKKQTANYENVDSIAVCSQPQQTALFVPDNLPLVAANDLLQPGGKKIEGKVYFDLVAEKARWKPNEEAGPSVRVFAFSEKMGQPRIPGPLLRVKQGQLVIITLENRIAPGAPIGYPPPNRRKPGMQYITGNELVIHGIFSAINDTSVVRLAYGEKKTLEFTATKPGRHIYWGSTSDQPLFSRTGIDAQLTGLIVVDPADHQPYPGERLFLITMMDAFMDTVKEGPDNDFFELAINGLSWPHTERLLYPLHKTQRWNWFNGSGFEHPMHLHGFHFRTLARQNGQHLQLPVEDEIQEVVTELMEPGSSFLMEWKPIRTGNWLMHCHIIDHVVPDLTAEEMEKLHQHQEGNRHALTAMAGLVMGITITDDEDPAPGEVPTQHLQLVARQTTTRNGRTPVRGFALDEDNSGSKGKFSMPGPPLILTRDELTRITVVNRIDQGTAVHWHGMELQSYYDGMPGWSGNGDKLAPVIPPGGTFDAYIKPVRSGTFIYHSHMDETDQLRSGMYGPLIVLEPGEQFQDEFDKILILGDAVDRQTGEYRGVTINGSDHPEPMRFKPGKTYRLRFINIGESSTLSLTLEARGELLPWKAVAKDGANLPIKLQVEQPASLRMGTGETYDFLFTPREPMQAEIVVDWPYPTFVGNKVIRQEIVVN